MNLLSQKVEEKSSQVDECMKTMKIVRNPGQRVVKDLIGNQNPKDQVIMLQLSWKTQLTKLQLLKFLPAHQQFVVIATKATWTIHWSLENVLNSWSDDPLLLHAVHLKQQPAGGRQ